MKQQPNDIKIKTWIQYFITITDCQRQAHNLDLNIVKNETEKDKSKDKQ